MTQFTISNPDFEQTIRDSFTKQGIMAHLSATLTTVEAGKVVIEMPYSDNITQQDKFIHAGAITTIVDSACGYAALTLMPPHSRVLSIEYKINFLSPAQGVKAIAYGEVLKPGRTIMVCQGSVFMVDDTGQEKQCATMIATMIQR